MWTFSPGTIPWLRVVLHDEIFRFGCRVTALQTSAGGVQSLLVLLHHLPVLRITLTLVIKKGMDPPSCLYPLACGLCNGDVASCSQVPWYCSMGSTRCPLPLHGGRPWSDALPHCLCFIDTAATCNTSTLQVPCCWLKYPQLWWRLWRATRSPLQHIHSFPGGVNLLKVSFFYEVSETCSAGNYLR